MSEKKYNVAIVGATGLVGGTFLKVLEEENFPIDKLVLLASSKSKGKIIKFRGKDYVVDELNENSFEGIDLALFSAGASVSKIYAPIAESKGAVVIDNSSCFRQDLDKALIVPEVNPDDADPKKGYSKIIANPNCSTIQAIVPLKPLDEKYGLKRVVYTTYQAVSGSGMKGILDLEKGLKGEECTFYPYNIASTCIPEIDVALDNGYTKEEMKMVNETRKMLHKPDLKISATCVRVPVKNCHAVSIMVELEKEFEVEDVKELIKNYEGLVLVDDLKNHKYPVSELANGNNLVYVGRIRRDLSCDNGLLLYTVADNIRKGAASNAVQIAKYMDEQGWIK
ncbi:MAG: aspartate-semialdehyde dehydrogenase [Bacilli bacterium]|nr:aspartate-semialdehyde dehydrogenase [Bacilli bacterium]